MAGVWTTLKIKDALGATLNMLAWDESGTGVGPWSYGHMFASTVTSLPVSLVGDVAHDSPDSGNPNKMGARARSSEITAVANNDRSDLITDLVGKLITLPYANPEN